MGREWRGSKPACADVDAKSVGRVSRSAWAGLGAARRSARRRAHAMRLIDYLDKGAMLGEESPCLTMGDLDMSYAQVQRLSHRVACGLQRVGIAAGDKVAVLSSNDALAFACVFGLSRAGAVWCPVNPRNEAAENRFVLDAFDCAALVFHSAYAPMVEQLRTGLPKVRLFVCIDQPCGFAPSLE